MSAPIIYCYHCICSHLVIATTRPLSSLPRRRTPGLDNAIIVPLPPPPRAADGDSDSESDDDEENVEKMEVDNRPETTSTTATVENPSTFEKEEVGEEDDQEQDYTLLLSSVRDRRACIIRRDDGFEKRLLWRCGRCRLIFGYQIDDDKLEEQEKELQEGPGKKEGNRRKKGYVYVLPGGVTSSEDMGSLGEKEVAIGKED